MGLASPDSRTGDTYLLIMCPQLLQYSESAIKAYVENNCVKRGNADCAIADMCIVACVLSIHVCV